ALPLGMQTASGLAAHWAAIDFYNLGGDYFEKYETRLNLVTVADVRRVAQERLREDKLAIVAVSSAGAIKGQLEKYGPIEVLDYRSPTGAIPQSRPTASLPTETLTPQAQAMAKTVVDRALKAHGGVARIKALKDVATRSTIAITTPNGSVEGDLMTSVRLPDKSRIEMSILGQRGVQVLNGDKGWATSGDKVQELNAEQTQAMRAGLKVQVLPRLARLASGAQVGYVGGDVVNGDSVDVIFVVDPDATS